MTVREQIEAIVTLGTGDSFAVVHAIQTGTYEPTAAEVHDALIRYTSSVYQACLRLAEEVDHLRSAA